MDNEFFISDENYIRYIDSHRICLEVILNSPKEFREKYGYEGLEKNFELLNKIPYSIIKNSICVLRLNYDKAHIKLIKVLSKKTKSMSYQERFEKSD